MSLSPAVSHLYGTGSVTPGPCRGPAPGALTEPSRRGEGGGAGGRCGPAPSALRAARRRRVTWGSTWGRAPAPRPAQPRPTRGRGDASRARVTWRRPWPMRSAAGSRERCLRAVGPGADGGRGGRGGGAVGGAAGGAGAPRSPLAAADGAARAGGVGGLVPSLLPGLLPGRLRAGRAAARAAGGMRRGWLGAAPALSPLCRGWRRPGLGAPCPAPSGAVPALPRAPRGLCAASPERGPRGVLGFGLGHRCGAGRPGWGSVPRPPVVCSTASLVSGSNLRIRLVRDV